MSMVVMSTKQMNPNDLQDNRFLDLHHTFNEYSIHYKWGVDPKRDCLVYRSDSFA